MPTYEYLCRQCGERMEIFQKFTDKPLRVHPDCGGDLQKVFHASGVVFKGSGYYTTDSRSRSSSSTPSNGSNESNGSKDSKTDSKPDKSGQSDTSSPSTGSDASKNTTD